MSRKVTWRRAGPGAFDKGRIMPGTAFSTVPFNAFDNGRRCPIVRAMKLIRQTPQELVLSYRPIGLCTALTSVTALVLALGVWNMTNAEWFKTGVALLAALGLAAPALWFWAERVQVAFDGTAGTVRIDRRALSGPSQEVFQLAHVREARVQIHKGRANRSGAYRVALCLTPGRAEDERPLTTGYTSKPEAETLVARINSWLDLHRADGGS